MQIYIRTNELEQLLWDQPMYSETNLVTVAVALRYPASTLIGI